MGALQAPGCDVLDECLYEDSCGGVVTSQRCNITLSESPSPSVEVVVWLRKKLDWCRMHACGAHVLIECSHRECEPGTDFIGVGATAREQKKISENECKNGMVHTDHPMPHSQQPLAGHLGQAPREATSTADATRFRAACRVLKSPLYAPHRPHPQPHLRAPLR